MAKVVNHRYGLTEVNGFILGVVHNWDGKTFDKNGYPVADCGARCYPRYIGYSQGNNTVLKVCKDCFK